MVRRIAIYTIAGAMLLTTGQQSKATSLSGVPLALKDSQLVQISSPTIEQFSSRFVRSSNILDTSATLIAADPFDSKTFQATFDRDPQLLAWATRMTPFWQFLVENDLIGMPQEKVVEMLGQGQPVEDAHATADDNKSPAESGNGRAAYLLITRISGAHVVATGVQIEYKGGKVARWRLFSSTNHYPITSPKDVFRVELVSRWVTQNVVESDICDFGLKVKKSLAFVSRDNTDNAFEDSRPPFIVASQKVLPTTEEPLALILLPQQPTSAELLNAAILCQQSLLVKVSREFAQQAISAAKSDAERKKAKSFIESRLPMKTPTWEVEQRHLISYAASKRKEPEAMSGYEKNIRDEPSFEYSYYAAGMLKREKQNLAGAQDMFERVLTLNPKYQKALFGLAAIKMQNGDSALAKKLALQAYFLYPYDDSTKTIYRSVTNEDPPETPPANLYGTAKSTKATTKGAPKKH
jgi:hypothetical protein